jgi:hypothetical protein
MAQDTYRWWNEDNNKWWRETMVLIEFVFYTSYVGFGSNVYKQKRGLPMGSPLSPVLANLYLAAVEDSGVDDFGILGLSYYRYLDDVLIIHSADAKFISRGNNRPTIVFMMEDLIKTITESSGDSMKFERTGVASKVGEYVEYLDLKVKIGENARAYRPRVIQFELFDKPTNKHIYTDPSTFYPYHYIYNWIQGENIRLIRNSSQPEDYEKALKDFKQFLIRRKYSKPLIDRFVELNPFEDRDELLRHEKPHALRNKKDKEQGNIQYLAVRNSGSRPLVTKAINVIDRFCHTLELIDFRIQPVVTQGSTVIEVMNKAKKNLGK